jgi:hypothetical protein
MDVATVTMQRPRIMILLRSTKSLMRPTGNVMATEQIVYINGSQLIDEAETWNSVPMAGTAMFRELALKVVLKEARLTQSNTLL